MYEEEEESELACGEGEEMMEGGEGVRDGSEGSEPGVGGDGESGVGDGLSCVVGGGPGVGGLALRPRLMERVSVGSLK